MVEAGPPSPTEVPPSAAPNPTAAEPIDPPGTPEAGHVQPTPDSGSSTASPPDAAANTAAAQPQPQETEQTEAPPTVEQDARTQVYQAWREGTELVADVYELDPTKVKAQLAAAGKPNDDAAAQAEITRRQEVLKAKPQLAAALEIRKRVRAVLTTAEKAIQAEEQKKGSALTDAEKQTTRARYYDEAKGIYREVSADGSASTEAHLTEAVKPIMDELQVLAQETQQSTPDKPAEPTPTAAKAKTVLDTLTTNATLEPSAAGGHILKIKEPPPAKEAEKPTDKILTTGERVVQELGINIDEMDEEAIKNLKASPALTGLLIDLVAYRHATPDGQRYVLLGIYERLQDPELLDLLKKPGTTITPKLQEQIEQLRRDPALHGEPGKPGELAKIEEDFLKYVGYPALAGKYGINWQHYAGQIDRSHLMRNFSFAVAFSQTKGISREIVSATFAKIREKAIKQRQSFNYTDDDVTLIAAMAEKGEGRDSLLATLEEMGITDPAELVSPVRFVKQHMDEILTISSGGEDLGGEKRTKRQDVFQQYCNIEDIKVQEKLLRKMFNPKLLYGLGGAVMLLTMFQNTLDFGVFLDSDEEGRGGH